MNLDFVNKIRILSNYIRNSQNGKNIWNTAITKAKRKGSINPKWKGYTIPISK